MKIAVFRALQLGDLLCIVPALRALDAAFPDARIALIGLPWAETLAKRYRRHLDGFMAFPGFPGMPERSPDLAALPAFFRAMELERFDLVLQMHGDGRLTNPLVAMMGAQATAGFYVPGRFCPDRERFLEWRAHEPEVLRYLRLVEALGVPAKGTHLEFPLGEEDWIEARRLRLPERGYAVVHPGSQLPSRRWPPGRFAAIADELAMDGLQVVLTGVASEAPVVEAVKRAMRQPALDLCGRTSLGGLAAVIARARLLVANDTGVSHIAAAVRTPSVIVACGSDAARWSPLDRELHRVLAHEVECRPCLHRECPVGHPCALGVSVRDVLNEVRSLSRAAA